MATNPQGNKTRCPKCGNELLPTDDECPYCPMEKSRGRLAAESGCLWGVVGLLVGGIVIGFVGGLILGVGGGALGVLAGSIVGFVTGVVAGVAKIRKVKL